MKKDKKALLKCLHEETQFLIWQQTIWRHYNTYSQIVDIGKISIKLFRLEKSDVKFA